MKAKKNGRPTKLTKKLMKKVKELLEQGYSNKVVCAEVGIRQSTFYDWQANNDKFSEIVESGRGLGEKKYIDMCKGLATGEKGQFNPVAFMLKNIYRYSDNPKDDTEDEKPINITFSIAEKKEN